MREDSLMTHDQMVAKWMENPEFRKVVFELDAQYAALDKALTKGKLNCLEQANDTRKRTPFHSVLQRPERRAMETSLALEDLKRHLHLLKFSNGKNKLLGHVFQAA